MSHKEMGPTTKRGGQKSMPPERSAASETTHPTGDVLDLTVAEIAADAVTLSVVLAPKTKAWYVACHAGSYQVLHERKRTKAKTTIKQVRFDGLLPGTEYTFSASALASTKTITVKTLPEVEPRKWRLYAITGFGLNSQSFDSRYEGLIATGDLLESVRGYGESVAKDWGVGKYSGGYVIDVTNAGEDGIAPGCLGYAIKDGSFGYVIDRRATLETRWKTDNDPCDPDNFRYFLYMVPNGKIVWIVAFTDDEDSEKIED